MGQPPLLPQRCAGGRTLCIWRQGRDFGLAPDVQHRRGAPQTSARTRQVREGRQHEVQDHASADKAGAKVGDTWSGVVLSSTLYVAETGAVVEGGLYPPG